MNYTIIVGFLLSVSIWSSMTMMIKAFPYGAGACPSNMAAVGDSHMRKGAKTGSVKAGGFNVTANMLAVPSNGIIQLKLASGGTSYSFQVQGPTYAGILFRMNNTKPKQVSPGNNLQIASVCGNVGGVTNKDSRGKTSGTMSVFFDKLGTYQLDLTIVVRNDDMGSTYYYSGYTVKLV